MEEGKERNEEAVEKTTERDEIYSNVVRAGKRTYFFDVKATRKNDYYLTITESKKRFNRNGRYFFEKHKIFLYKEDFDKFSDALAETLDFIKTSSPTIIGEDNESDQASPQNAEQNNGSELKENAITENYTTDVQFEDLENSASDDNDMEKED